MATVMAGLAERVRFELTETCVSAVFKTAAIGRSATSPLARIAAPRADAGGATALRDRARFAPPVRPSDLLDDDRTGDEIVPAALALVDEDPDEADVEDEAVDPVADQPEERLAAGEWTTIPITHDA